MNYDELINKPATNYEGGPAFPMSKELELYTAVVTSSLSSLTYETVDERVDRISELVRQCSPEFVAKLAVYARQKMNLRSVPLLLAVELAKVHHGDDLVSRVVEKIVQRADEIMELLTCYQWRNAQPDSKKQLGHLSSQIQKGLKRAFNNFDEYQFAKYDKEKRTVKLRDALFIVHPHPKDEAQQEIFNKIASQSLPTPYTWETELSALGQKQFATEEEKQLAISQKWSELIHSGKLGYMALLRNLRNILNCSKIDMDDIARVCEVISDPNAIKAARQLPFRYLAAYREVKPIESPFTSMVLDALESAVKYTADSISGFDSKSFVVIASDVSGSMDYSISPRSTIKYYDIGLMLSMMLKEKCQRVIAGIFGNIWKPINLPSGNVLANVDKMYDFMGEVGYDTNGHLVIDYLADNNIYPDKVMIFTDLQMWDSEFADKSLKDSWKKYKEKGANAKLYLFDLSGYGQSPISLREDDVYLIAGWSDKIFDMLQSIEDGHSAVEQINSKEI